MMIHRIFQYIHSVIPVKTISSRFHKDYVLTWLRSSYALVNERHNAQTGGGFDVADNICSADGALKC